MPPVEICIYLAISVLVGLGLGGPAYYWVIVNAFRQRLLKHWYTIKTLEDQVKAKPSVLRDGGTAGCSKSHTIGVRHPPLLAGKPIVILFNRRTASAGELMIAVLVQNGEVGADARQ